MNGPFANALDRLKTVGSVCRVKTLLTGKMYFFAVVVLYDVEDGIWRMDSTALWVLRHFLILLWSMRVLSFKMSSQYYKKVSLLEGKYEEKSGRGVIGLQNRNQWAEFILKSVYFFAICLQVFSKFHLFIFFKIVLKCCPDLPFLIQHQNLF